MKKILFFAILILAIAVIACSNKGTTSENKGTITSNVVKDQGKTVTTTVETDKGKQTTTVTGENIKDSWCPEGGNWQMTSTGGQGDSTATWKIDKLIASGEYAGLCHVIYTFNSGEGQAVMDYYFDQSGKNGYYEMNANGQKIKQEWHG